MVYIYVCVCVCQQHGGLLGGSRYRCNISVNFVSLLLFSSAKNLLAIRSLLESYLQISSRSKKFRGPSSCMGTRTSVKMFSSFKTALEGLKN